MSGTLNICCFCWCSSWFNRSYSWCVGCRCFCSVLIFADNCHSWCSSDEWFFWYKCNSTVWSYCVCTNTFNGLSCWTVIECCWNIFVDFNSLFNAINRYSSTLKFRFTCLSSTLDVFCFSWCCSWCYWNNLWSVSCINLDSVWAFSLNLNRRYFTCVRLISWCEGYSSSCWVDRECTDWCCSIFRVSCCSWNFVTIFIQKFVAVIFNSDFFVFTIYRNSCTRKGWFTCLSSTLDIFRCSWICCWYSCFYSRCVACIRSDSCSFTISICNCRSCLNFNPFSGSDKVFLRSEGYRTCSRINWICSFTFYCHSSFISRLTSCWVYQFLTCDFRSLIVAQLKCRSLSLWNVLDILRNLVCWSDSNWSYSWCVLSCSCLNVLLLNLTIFITSNWCW